MGFPHVGRCAFAAIRCLILVAFVALPFVAGAQTLSREVAFDVPPQLLSTAIIEFSKQAQVQILASGDKLGGIQSPGVKGRFSVEQGLQKLLDGTGLSYKTAGEGTVSLVPVEKRSEQGTNTEVVKAEGIIVTAQKRSERLSDVPISMSVIGGKDLDRSTVQGVSEALGTIPGVAVSPSNQVDGTLLSIRGVSAPGVFNSGASAIGYYLDSVPFGSVRQGYVPDAGSYDLDRIEVLRGPQGTLYGAGSLNGVVRVLTKDADLNSVEFKGRTAYSHTDFGGDNVRADVAANLPLVEGKVGARVALGYQGLGGWIDRETRPDANDGTVRTARFKLNAQPSDALSIGLSVWISRTDLSNPSWGLADRTSPALDIERTKSDFDLYGAKIGYDFSSFYLTSSTGYMKHTSDTMQDATPSGLDGQVLRTRLTPDMFSEEVNLTSHQPGPWKWSAGGIYRDGQDRLFQTLTPLFPLPQSIKFTSKSWAVFGELTRSFLDGDAEITAGLRYFKDRVGMVEESRLGFAEPSTFITTDDTFNKTTPRVVLAWHPQPETMTYVSYAEGFRSGFPQLPSVLRGVPDLPAVKPDLLKNYEIGIKGSLWRGRVEYDAAAYYMDWRDVQLPLVVNVGGINRSAAVNGPSASGGGVDLALTTSPAPGLQLGINGSWNNLRVDSDVVIGDVPFFRKGDRLGSSYQYTFGVLGNYSFPLDFRGLRGRVSASYNLTSPLETVTFGDAGEATVTRGDSIGSGRLAFSIESAAKWTATLYVDNFTNENGVAVPGPPNGVATTPRLQPRTIGVQFDYQF